MSILVSAVFGILVLGSVSASAAVTTSVVDIPTRGVTKRILYLRPDAPKALIVNVPGGDGFYNISDAGDIRAQQCGPIARNRQAFAERGFAVALVDRASDGATYRLPDIGEVVRYLRERDAIPTWLAGGSNATETIALFATYLPIADPVGVIFFSPQNILASQAASIMRPTQVVFHRGDSGQFGPALFNALTSAPAKEITPLMGGIDTPHCGFHLFNGIDAAFTAAVAGFIDKHNGSLANPAPQLALAVEFHNAALDHYFLTHIADEIALLDAGVAIKGWARTGQSFNVYTAATAGSSPVCRYYIPPDKGDSHFYGRGTDECTATGAANPTFFNEDPQFFQIMLPTAGTCPAGTRNVYRVFSNRADANHRYMVEGAIREEMVAKGWLAEGDGPNLVVTCSPI